jgi:hypothetical protein
MGKSDHSANLRATRGQINNANASAQMRAFKARQLAKQKRDAEARKLRAAQGGAKGAATATAETTLLTAATTEMPADGAGEQGKD